MHTKLLLAAINFRPAAVLVVLLSCQIRTRAEAGGLSFGLGGHFFFNPIRNPTG